MRYFERAARCVIASDAMIDEARIVALRRVRYVNTAMARLRALRACRCAMLYVDHYVADDGDFVERAIVDSVRTRLRCAHAGARGERLTLFVIRVATRYQRHHAARAPR